MESLTKSQKIGGFGLVLVIYILYRFKRLVEWQKITSKTCPGPKCHPLLGNIQEMIDAKGFSEELFFNLHRDHGDIVRFFLGPTICNFSINNPELIHEIYKKCRERPHETYLFLWYLGKENLLFQRGQMVRLMRHRYGEMVAQRSQLDKLNNISLDAFKLSVDSWCNESETSTSVDVHAKLGPVIYDIMGRVLFDAPWLDTEEGKHIYKLHKYLILEVNRWVLYPVGPIFHPAFIKYLMTIREWRNCVGNLLDKRAKEMRANPKKYENDHSAIAMIHTSTHDDGVTPFFTRERAISTMCGFLNGAYDTTHATSYWIIWHLAKNPDVQDKLFEEFERVLKCKERPDVDELRQCEYLHAFLMESMRSKATVPVNQRVNDNEDVKIGDYIIPKGTNINIPNGVYFKDSRWFGPRTDLFRPERFLGSTPEAELARKSWVPFGEHTRVCIGQIFALAEMKVMIYNLITRSIIELEDPSDLGEVMIEAGVNQPVKHNKFIFKKRDLKKVKEEENLKWWMSQTEALEKMKPAASNLAQMA